MLTMGDSIGTDSVQIYDLRRSRDLFIYMFDNNFYFIIIILFFDNKELYLN